MAVAFGLKFGNAQFCLLQSRGQRPVLLSEVFNGKQGVVQISVKIGQLGMQFIVWPIGQARDAAEGKGVQAGSSQSHLASIRSDPCNKPLAFQSLQT